MCVSVSKPLLDEGRNIGPLLDQQFPFQSSQIKSCSFPPLLFHHDKAHTILVNVHDYFNYVTIFLNFLLTVIQTTG